MKQVKPQPARVDGDGNGLVVIDELRIRGDDFFDERGNDFAWCSLCSRCSQLSRCHVCLGRNSAQRKHRSAKWMERKDFTPLCDGRLPYWTGVQALCVYSRISQRCGQAERTMWKIAILRVRPIVRIQVPTTLRPIFNKAAGANQHQLEK